MKLEGHREQQQLRSPPLPMKLEVEWDDFAKKYAKKVGSAWKKAVGIRFITEMSDLMKELGEHLLPDPDAGSGGPKPAPGSGRKDALDRFIKRQMKKFPKASTSLTV